MQHIHNGWDSTISWADTKTVNRYLVDEPIRLTDICRVVHNMPTCWVVYVVVQLATSTPPSDIILRLRKTCGNGRVSWQEDTLFTITAAQQPQIDTMKTAVYVPARSVAVSAGYTCISADSNVVVTASIAPLGYGGRSL